MKELAELLFITASKQVVEAVTANGLVTLRARALPLPAAVASSLDENADVIRSAAASQQQRTIGSGGRRDSDSAKPSSARDCDVTEAAPPLSSGSGVGEAAQPAAAVDQRCQNGAAAASEAAAATGAPAGQQEGGALAALQKRSV